MSVMKYTRKYLLRVLLCVIVVIGIIGIGGLIHNHRTNKETVQTSESDQEVVLPIPELSTKPSASGGHFHTDGTFHATAAPQVNGTASQRWTASRRSSRQKAANRSSLGWITWKYGRTGIRATSPYYPDWTPLPQEIEDAVDLLWMERFARISLNNRVNGAKRDGRKIDLSDTVDFVGKINDLPDPMSVLLDKKGNPLPPFTESEYAEEELRRLVGDRDLEAATQFLEQHGHYNKLLLSRLSDERAFDYLYSISYPNGSGVPDGSVRLYAERVVASDLNHLKARLYLADMSPLTSLSDCAAVLSEYESILVDHPDSANAWIEAAALLIPLEKPLQAVEYFKRGHELGARQGFFQAGTAYQQLGDYKTAWVYLKKALQVVEGGSHQQFAVAKHLDAIESGAPLVSPLPVEKLDISKEVSLDFFSSATDFAFDVPPSETEVPLLLDSDLSESEVEYQRARAQARAAAEAARREEFDSFLRWMEQIESATSVKALDNFLMRDMFLNLHGSDAKFTPDRLIRAFETFQRHGERQGRIELEKRDAELAREMARQQRPTFPRRSAPDTSNIRKD